MTLYNKKHPERYIKVESKKNKIHVKRGFVVIAATSEYVDQTIRPDILRDNYIIPEDVEIMD